MNGTKNSRVRMVSLVVAAGFGTSAFGQSLFLQPPPSMIDGEPDTPSALLASSMFVVQPPQPRQFQVHDIVHVLINESTSATSSQSLETTKELTLEQQLNGIIDPLKLLELQLEAAAANNLTLADLETTSEFTGEGDYDRQDRLSARIAAEVLDVKPNGTLVLRARKSVGTDDEEQVITLTGIARGEDITDEGTVLSSQLADLAVAVENSGEVRKAAQKGFITKALDWLFNF
jgi:flagellar L-ring protein precursor FlgH